MTGVLVGRDCDVNMLTGTAQWRRGEDGQPRTSREASGERSLADVRLGREPQERGGGKRPRLKLPSAGGTWRLTRVALEN